MIDDMVVYIVRAVAGCPEFSSCSGARLMGLVVWFWFVSSFSAGGSGVLSREYAMVCFDGADFKSVDGGLSVEGWAYAYKVVRRLVLLGRCVHGLLCVA